MRTAVAILTVAAVLGLGGCSSGEEESGSARSPVESTTATAAAASPTATVSATPSSSPTSTSTPTPAVSTSTRAADDVLVDMQAAVVASVAESTFADAREQLLAVLKSGSDVEAVEEFAFDRETSTLSIEMASVYDVSEDAMASVAYDVATGLAPLMWAPAIASQVTDTAALPAFDLQVDGLRFVCDGEAMAALADTALSQESFVEQCQQ
jgi:hypothetical protein